MPETGDQPNPTPEPQHPSYFTRLPNGELVNFFEAMDHLNKGGLQLNAGLLKKGDILAIQYAKPDESNGGFLFKLQTKSWHNLGIESGHAPSPTLGGELQGPELPLEVQGKTVYFIGSGLGHAMIKPKFLGTTLSPEFSIDNDRFTAPAVTNFRVFRKTENERVQPLTPEQIIAEARKENAQHNQRLVKIQELMLKFGFDKYNFRDTSKSSKDYRQLPIGEPEPERENFIYEDERYKAEFEASMASGNMLAVIDKKTHQWIEFKYFNFSDEDILQIGLSDLAGQDLNSLFITGSILSTSSIHSAGTSITTFITSENSGIQAINYKTSEKDSSEILRIPSYQDRIPCPHIQFFPERGEITIPPSYPLNYIEQDAPGIRAKIQTSIGWKTFEDGSLAVTLNGHERKLKNPDREIENILNHWNPPKAEKHISSTSSGPLRSVLNRFRRK